MKMVGTESFLFWVWNFLPWGCSVLEVFLWETVGGSLMTPRQATSGFQATQKQARNELMPRRAALYSVIRWKAIFQWESHLEIVPFLL